MPKFNKDMSIEEILEKLQTVVSITFEKEIGEYFFQYKLQQQLLSEQNEQQKKILWQQNEYNKKQLSHSMWLVIGTWVLAIATCALAVVTLLSKK
ncbi:MAG: hypothetical protein LHV68_08635 [Elusimicrobia bacterium]|nr:hypothetical protein [Candidatus Liberimonas magnetica]